VLYSQECQVKIIEFYMCEQNVCTNRLRKALFDDTVTVVIIVVNVEWFQRLTIVLLINSVSNLLFRPIKEP